MNKTNTISSIRYISDTEALVSKSFAKKAQLFGSTEFKLWREYLAYYPKAQMVHKTIKRNPNKRVVTKNMTYENMRIFIGQQDNSVVLMKEFEKELKLSKIKENPYRSVLAWFMQKFENVNDYKAFFESLSADAQTEYLSERPNEAEEE